jgi:hypothetical protein
VLRIKDVWLRLPSYPDRIGGSEIYTAVIDDGVPTLEQFSGWLADRGLTRSLSWPASVLVRELPGTLLTIPGVPFEVCDRPLFTSAG